MGECAIARKSGGVLTKPKQGRDKNDGSFDHVAERWLKAKLDAASSNKTKLRAWRDDQGLYLAKNGLAAFFGHQDVRTITTDSIREFLAFQVAKSAKETLATSTQKRCLVTLRCILKNAFERGLLSAIPLMPTIKVVDNPRPYFTRKEIQRLRVTAWIQARAARASGDTAAFDHWMEMADFVLFMVSTWLRHSEWQALRHFNIKVVAKGETPHIFIRGIKGKTGLRDGVSRPAAIKAYANIVKRYGDQPDIFLFPQFKLRQTATERMRDSFEKLLHLSGLKADQNGSLRVVNSLRHSAIMFSILETQADVQLIAKAAGTSVDQIERFYASRLKVSMMLGELQGLKGR